MDTTPHFESQIADHPSTCTLRGRGYAVQRVTNKMFIAQADSDQ